MRKAALPSEPSVWAGDAPTHRGAVALMVIDMQNDFCAPGGWVDQLGQDIANTAAVVAPVARLLAAARAAGVMVIHTREGHDPDLSDLPANKRWRTRRHGLGIGDRGAAGRILVRGEPGWQIVPMLAPRPGERVVDKPGKSAFHDTGLDAALRRLGIGHLILAGVTTDCCVQASLRDAHELGFAGIVVSDCTAAVETANHHATLDILAAHGGRWGRVAPASDVLAALGDVPV